MAAAESSLATRATALFRNLKLENDSPIFSKSMINFRTAVDIVDLVASNYHLVLAMTNNIIMKVDFSNPDFQEELDLSKYLPNGIIYKMFIDPSGQHLIISLKSPKGFNDSLDTIYVPWKSKKLRVIGKLRGQTITSVAWR